MAVAKNNVDYFPFLCKEGKTLRFIDGKYGNDGFSTWVRLLRELAITDYHFLDLAESTDISDLAIKFKIDEAFLIDLINDLAIRKEIDADLWNTHRVVFSSKFIASVRDAYKKRVNNKPVDSDGIMPIIEAKRRENGTLSSRAGGIMLDSGTGMTQRKEEESKEKESIVERAVAVVAGLDLTFSYDFKHTSKERKIEYPYNSKNFLDAWARWLHFRANVKKKPYESPEAVQMVLSSLSKHDEATAIEMIEQAISNEWLGIYKLKGTGNGNGHTKNRKQQHTTKLAASVAEAYRDVFTGRANGEGQ